MSQFSSFNSLIPFPYIKLSLSFPHQSYVLMRRYTGKGKRKASPSLSPSSSSANESDDDTHVVRKRTRLTSPARVKQAALAKVASKSLSSSSSKGLAGFAALVNKANLSAAQAETSRGLRSVSSSRFRGGASARVKGEKTVSGVILHSENLISFLLPGRCIYRRHNRFLCSWGYEGTSATIYPTP